VREINIPTIKISPLPNTAGIKRNILFSWIIENPKP